MVQIHPDPPQILTRSRSGAIAQLGERLLCKQEVTGSIPVGSTSNTKFKTKCPSGHFVLSFIRLLFNNSEEVKRIRFSQTGFVWVVIALRVVPSASITQLCGKHLIQGAQGYRVK